jgi:Zn-dependent protease
VPGIDVILYSISVWALPAILAITMHEAAHGFASRLLGDDTAWREGRVTLNPIRHIDPVGTLLIPVTLLVFGSPFMFGYAKPVPVNFGRLRNPRSGMVLVAAAGPAINIVLATVSAILLIYVSDYLPDIMRDWAIANLRNSVLVNLVLAVFNLLPLPPLDGGRILVGLLPRQPAMALARVEPYGFFILIGVLFILPMLGRQLGLSLDFVSRAVLWGVNTLLDGILLLIGGG